MELAQLGALKTLLREVLASARNSSAAAANAQCAANAATAAVEAVAALRKAMDTVLHATPPSAAAAAAVPGNASAIRSKAGGESRPAHWSCERPLPSLRRAWDEGTPDRFCTAEGWGKNDSVRVTSHLLSLQATSLEAGSSTGFSAASTTTDVLAWAAPLTGAEAKQISRGHHANGAQASGALVIQDRPEAMAEAAETGLAVRLESARLLPNSSRLDAGPRESGSTEALAAAMLPVQGGLRRSRDNSTFVARSSLHRDHVFSFDLVRSASPPPTLSLPYRPYTKPSPLQRCQRRTATQPTTADPIGPQIPHRRRIRLAAASGGASRLARAPCHSPSTPGAAGGQGVQAAAAAGGATQEAWPAQAAGSCRGGWGRFEPCPVTVAQLPAVTADASAAKSALLPTTG